MEHTFQYRSEIHEIPKIREDLEALEKAWGIPKSKMQQIRVIVEELFSNIVRFAYEDQKEHTIELRMNRMEDKVEIVIIDDGIAFNPLEHDKEPLQDQALLESGGMGLTLVQTFSNKMTYERLGENNQLRIEKKI